MLQMKVKVTAENDGNLLLNQQNQHSGEFGGKLVYWVLQGHANGGGSAATPVTGKKGDLAQPTDRKSSIAVSTSSSRSPSPSMMPDLV